VFLYSLRKAATLNSEEGGKREPTERRGERKKGNVPLLSISSMPIDEGRRGSLLIGIKRRKNEVE